MLTTKNSAADLLIRKLQCFTCLSEDDRAALARLGEAPLLEVQPHRDLIREGDQPKKVSLMVSGWVCRYKDLPDGRRQYLSFLIPGDLCDANAYVLKKMDHSIGAITRVTYLQIAPKEMERITLERPRIAQALWWHELVNASIQREWLLNVGQRSAYERIAHLLVEMFVRLRVVDLTDRQSCEFPITQTDLADATGLTTVHVNRTPQDLRREGLIELANRRLTIPDLDKLMNAAMFNPDYLHLDRNGRHLDAND